MYIEGTSPEIEARNLEFDNGTLITADVPQLSLTLDYEAEGKLTDHIVAPGVKGLLVTNRLLSKLCDAGIDNLQSFPLTLLGFAGEKISDEYRVVNIVGRVNGIDIDNSDVELVPGSSDEIEFVNKLVLKHPIPGDPIIFRLNENSQIVVVRNVVREIVESNSLSGIKFCLPEEFYL